MRALVAPVVHQGRRVRRLLGRLVRAVRVHDDRTPLVSWQVADPSLDEGFAHKVVVVSGAAGLLGRRLVHAVATQGAIVHALDIDADGLARAAAAWPGTVHCHVGNLADDDDVARIVGEVAATSTRVDALLQSVGGGVWKEDLADLDGESWRRVLDGNLIAPALLTRALADLLAESPSAGVVIITSINARMTSRWPHYAAAKAGAAKLVIDLAVQLAPRGIRINAVAPGAFHDDDAGDWLRFERRAVLTKSAVPVDAIVHSVLFLADPLRSPCTTGQELAIDSGHSLSVPTTRTSRSVAWMTTRCNISGASTSK